MKKNHRKARNTIGWDSDGGGGGGLGLVWWWCRGGLVVVQGDVRVVRG